MKLIVLTCCVIFVAIQNVQGEDEYMITLKECLEENDIKGDFEILKKNDDPKLRCIMACVMEKEGFLKNGEVKMDLLKKDLLEDAEQLGEKKVSELVDYCGNEAKDLTDVCDKTNLIGLCIEEELEKYHIKFE